MENTKGFTLLEMMIVVAIVAILATTATVSMSGRAESNAVIKARTMIPQFINNGIDRAFEEGREYELDMSGLPSPTSNPKLVLDGRVKKEIVLPKILEYTTTKNKVNIDSRGGFLSDFTITVKNKDGDSKFEVKCSNITGVGIGKVEVD
ncbi:MAG: type II secretion system protein [Fusobacteriota bacterium]